MFAIAKSILTGPVCAGLICAGLAASAGAQEATQPKRTTQVFDDWTVECISPPAPEGSTERPPDRCEMRTQVTVRGDDDVERPLIQFGIGELGFEDGFWIVVQTPLKVLLQKGVQIVLNTPEGDDPDAGKALVLTRFLYCAPTHCVSQGRMGAAQLDALGEAEGARVVFTASPENVLEIPLSLDGYPAAYDAITK